MSTVAPTIRKPERKYKKPRIMCPNGCGQMVSVRLNGIPHGHICEKIDTGDIPDLVPEDVKDKTQSEAEEEPAPNASVNTIPSSPVPKVNSIIDAKTTHPKLKMKQLMSEKIEVDFTGAS